MQLTFFSSYLGLKTALHYSLFESAVTDCNECKYEGKNNVFESFGK